MGRKQSSVLRAFVVICFAVVHGSAEICQMIDQCSCKKSSGKIISLWDIDGGSKEPAFSNIKDKKKDNYAYSWNPCTKYKQGDGCKDVLMCQVTVPSSSQTFPCADTVAEFKVESDGRTAIMYKELTDDIRQYQRTVIINLQCDESQSPGKMSDVLEDQEAFLKSTYTATLTSKCACDDGCSHPTDNVSNGLSAGSILLIVFFVLLFVYLIAGILVNKYKLGVESMPEMCPNYKFWAGIPSLIKDGVLFSWGGMKSGCSSLCQMGTKDSYKELP